MKTYCWVMLKETDCYTLPCETGFKIILQDEKCLLIYNIHQKSSHRMCYFSDFWCTSQIGKNILIYLSFTTWRSMPDHVLLLTTVGPGELQMNLKVQGKNIFCNSVLAGFKSYHNFLLVWCISEHTAARVLPMSFTCLCWLLSTTVLITTLFLKNMLIWWYPVTFITAFYFYATDLLHFKRLQSLTNLLKLDNFVKQCNNKLPCLLGTPGLLALLQGHVHPKQHIILYRQMYVA